MTWRCILLGVMVAEGELPARASRWPLLLLTVQLWQENLPPPPAVRQLAHCLAGTLSVGGQIPPVGWGSIFFGLSWDDMMHECVLPSRGMFGRA